MIAFGPRFFLNNQWFKSLNKRKSMSLAVLHQNMWAKYGLGLSVRSEKLHNSCSFFLYQVVHYYLPPSKVFSVPVPSFTSMPPPGPGHGE